MVKCLSPKNQDQQLRPNYLLTRTSGQKIDGKLVVHQKGARILRQEWLLHWYRIL
jgi:hypothetical protein